MPKAPVRTPRIDPNFARFKMEIKRSKILVATASMPAKRIPARRKVIEYTGERLNRKQAKDRDRGKYTYLFALDAYWTLDGAVGGSGAEIINHSCEPNLVARIIKGHIIYMSLRPIRRGEELLIDYHFAKNGDKTECFCGAKTCRGIIEK